MVIIHSGQLEDKMPTRSLGSIPKDAREEPIASTLTLISSYDSQWKGAPSPSAGSRQPRQWFLGYVATLRDQSRHHAVSLL